MIRKQTWILVVIFVILLAVVFYLQKNPLPTTGANVTPSATSPVSLLPGFGAQEIMFVSIKNGDTSLQLSNNGGNWVLLPENKPVDVGKAEEIRAQLADLHISANLPASFSVETVGLSTPAQTIALKNSQGKQIEMKIGKMTPTGDGYYVQVDNNNPVVVNKGTIDTLIEQISLSNLAPTPTLAITPNPTISVTPTP